MPTVSPITAPSGERARQGKADFLFSVGSSYAREFTVMAREPKGSYSQLQLILLIFQPQFLYLARQGVAPDTEQGGSFNASPASVMQSL